jgi:hypothetical protein
MHTTSAIAAFAFALLAGCANFGSSSRNDDTDDFVAFGETMQAAANAGRLAIFDEARAEYLATGTAASAIRLVLASVGIEAEVPSDTLMLLDYADRNAANEAQRQFVAFLRPLVERLLGQQSIIESAAAANRLLESQLEALKELEEQLNSSEGQR